MTEKGTEYQLVQAILDGEKERYAEIVEHYQQVVANLCYKLVGDKVDCDEVVQQVFVELYTSLPRFRFESKLSTFIYKITVNVVAKNYNKANRIVSFDQSAFENQPGDLNEEEQTIREERRKQLRKAIGSLHQEQRTALVLYTYEDFSYQEIADVMQVSLSKVESLIFRAKKNLKKILGQDKN